MTFINLLLLGGAAAAAIPLVIHLLNRSRYRVVQWGAMHLLDQVVRQNRRRLRWEQLLLLLVRMGIPVLLALAMARPVLTGIGALSGNAKSSLLVMMDNSYSMDAGGTPNSSYDHARREALAALERLPRGSEAGVLLMGGKAQPLLRQPTVNLSRLTEELTHTRAGHAAADVAGSLQAGASIAGEFSHAKRDLLILSDFQKRDWSDATAPARAQVLQLMRQMPIRPSLTLFPVGRPAEDNVAVEAIRFSRLVLGVGQEFTVRADVRNFGQRDYPDLRVYFRVDGQERGVTQIPLPAGQRSQVLFTHRFTDAGSHVIEVFADADALAADNTLMAAVPVWDRIPVLLVTGDANPQPLRSETAYLEIALRPFTAGKTGLSDLIETRTIEPRDLGAKALVDCRVAVLANVHQLSDSQLKDLHEFVSAGGSLLICPGDRINIAWYNSRLFNDGKGLMPLRIASLAGSLTDASEHAAVVPGHFDHPALDLFNDPRNGSLSDARIWHWYQLDPPADADRAREQGLSVMARLDRAGAAPFLVERRFGQGLCLMTATAVDADWSNLPLRGSYVQLMQQLVAYAASKVYPPRNIEVGQPLIAFLSAPSSGKEVTVTTPDGRRQKVQALARGGRAVVEFPLTSQPGLYVVEPSDPAEPLVHVVASTSRDESDLDRLDEAGLKALAAELEATVVRDGREYAQLDQTRRFGREVWRYLFVVAAVLMFGELFLQQWLTRRRG